MGSNPNVIYSVLLGALAACGILAILAYFLSRPTEADQMALRLNRYAGGASDVSVSSDEARPSPGFRELIDRFTTSLNPVLDRTSHSGQLADDLAKADLRIKSSEWTLGVFGAGLLLGLLLSIRFTNPIWLIPAIFGIYFAAGFFLRFRQRRRLRAFNRQLGDTILLLSNALKAGYSFAQALATVSKSSRPPIGDEFARATREIQLGISMDEALTHMIERNQSEDFDLLITAVQIQRVVGGNLAEILDTIAFTIRERVRITGEIRTLTAQARFSGYIIVLLPIGLAAFLYFVQPSYFDPMFKETVGKIMMAVGATSMLIGIVIIQKMVQIEI